MRKAFINAAVVMLISMLFITLLGFTDVSLASSRLPKVRNVNVSTLNLYTNNTCDYRVSWSKVDGASGYRIIIDEDTFDPSYKYVSKNARSFVLKSCYRGTGYSFQVQAYKSTASGRQYGYRSASVYVNEPAVVDFSLVLTSDNDISKTGYVIVNNYTGSELQVSTMVSIFADDNADSNIANSLITDGYISDWFSVGTYSKKTKIFTDYDAGYFRLANDTQIAYEVKYEGQRYIVLSYADGTEMFFSTVDD